MNLNDIDIFGQYQNKDISDTESRLARITQGLEQDAKAEPVEPTPAEERVAGLASLLQKGGERGVPLLGTFKDPRQAYQMSQKLLRLVDPKQQGGIGELLPGFSFELARERDDRLGQGLSLLDLVPLAGPIAKQTAKKGITAFHGTGADFDKFDASKIGTGTGAQYYGYGLYFAKSKKTAQMYADETGGQNILYDGKLMYKDGKLVNDLKLDDESRILIESDSGDLARTRKNIQGEIADFEKNIKQAKEEIKKGAGGSSLIDSMERYVKNKKRQLSKIDSLEPKIKVEKGSVYKVKLDVDEDDLLDYNEPLDKQPNPAVQKKVASMPYFKELKKAQKKMLDYHKGQIAKLEQDLDKLKSDPNYFKNYLNRAPYYLKKVKKETLEEQIGHIRNEITEEKITALGVTARDNLYMKTKNSVQDPDFNSALRKANIKGMKYFYIPFDKRMSGENFVIFDPRIIEITKKYGVTVPVASAMLLQADLETGNLNTENLDNIDIFAEEDKKNR